MAASIYRRSILSLPCGEQKRQNRARVKYWEMIVAGQPIK
jgi:hypothetical protein